MTGIAWNWAILGGITKEFFPTGGELIGEMNELIIENAKITLHAEELISQIKDMWDEWDCKEKAEKQGLKPLTGYWI